MLTYQHSCASFQQDHLLSIYDGVHNDHYPPTHESGEGSLYHLHHDKDCTIEASSSHDLERHQLRIIKETLMLFQQSDLGLLEWRHETDTNKQFIKLERCNATMSYGHAPGAVSMPVYTAQHNAPQPLSTTSKEATQSAEDKNSETLRSPLVGTLYVAPGPNADAFVKVGDRIKKGDVVFIIDTMKVMNRIKVTHDGVVTDIHVANGEVVEYGAPLLTLNTKL